MDQDADNTLNEPSGEYAPMKHMQLHSFASFDEAARSDFFAAARQSPLDRIRETVQLILRAYGVTEADLRKRRKQLHLTIISYK
jgi:hypothetical protein